MSNALYEGILPKLITIISLLNDSDVSSSSQSKQTLIKAINDFKESIAQAKIAAAELAGGELTIEEQGNIIEMLDNMKRTQRALLQSSLKDIASSRALGHVDMDVDSTASTPVGN